MPWRGGAVGNRVREWRRLLLGATALSVWCANGDLAGQPAAPPDVQPAPPAPRASETPATPPPSSPQPSQPSTEAPSAPGDNKPLPTISVTTERQKPAAPLGEAKRKRHGAARARGIDASILDAEPSPPMGRADVADVGDDARSKFLALQREERRRQCPPPPLRLAASSEAANLWWKLASDLGVIDRGPWRARVDQHPSLTMAPRRPPPSWMRCGAQRGTGC